MLIAIKADCISNNLPLQLIQIKTNYKQVTFRKCDSSNITKTTFYTLNIK